jgi:Zinc finger, ZZ type
MFLGYTSAGIQAELECAWSCGEICSKHDPPLVPLASTETAILKLAASLPHKKKDCGSEVTPPWAHLQVKPEWGTIAAGILPYLQGLLEREMKYMKDGKDPQPEAWSSLVGKVHAADPRGIDGYTCKICAHELCNSYYRCSDCFQSGKDYNVCVGCFKQRKGKAGKNCKHLESWPCNCIGKVCPSCEQCDVHLCSCEGPLNKGRCNCFDKLCNICKLCAVHQCSCVGHKKLELRVRYYTCAQLGKILENCQNWAM